MAQTATTTMQMREAFGSTLVELAGLYPELYVLDGDLANSTRAEVFEEQYPDRFLEMGIAEQNMMGVAAGLATVGITPWLSSFSCFLVHRDLDQLRVVVAQPNLNVKIGAGYAGLFTGRTGRTHQDFSDVAVLRSLPNLVIVCPADGIEVRQAMHAVMKHRGPCYVRLVRDATPVIFGDDHPFELGKAQILREGTDITIISTGAQTVRALEATEILARDGVSAHLLHVPTVKPLDVAAIVAAAARTGRVLTTEEHTVIGGLGGAVAEALGEHRPTPMRRHGINDVYGESGSNEDLLEKYEMTGRHVAAAAKDLWAASR